MTTLQTADGRLLRSQRPAGASFGTMQGAGLFRPMWSDGSSDHDGADGTYLASFESIYRTQPVLAGAVDKLARRIATLPFGSYRVDQRDQRKLVRGDSLDSLIRRPWPKAATLHLLVNIAQSMLIHGNALVAKLRTADREAPPFMLWPLDWSQMSAYGPEGGRIEWWSTTQFDRQERFLSADNVMLFAWPSPSGGEIGVSPLEKLGVTFQNEAAAQQSQTASFRNGNRPSLLISVPGSLQQQQLDMMRDSIERLHKGVSNTGKTLFLTNGGTAEPLSLSPVEAALIEQRRLNREDIGIVYDLSGPLMNDLTHGTYSNVEELLKSLYRDVLPPWTELIVGTFQAQLLDLEPAWMDRVVRFDYTDKLKGDPRELSETTRSDVEGGLRTRNEGRQRLGEPPVGDPEDESNPANQLTANTNNQDTLENMSGTSTPPRGALTT